MAYLLPISTDPLDSPSHSLLHRIITVDSAAAEQSLKIDSSSNAIITGGVVVDTSFTGKQIATPSNPAAGYNKAYFKSGDRLYLLTSGGTESLVGNISGSTGSTDNAILRADGTGTTTLQSTGITIDDNNNLVLPTPVAGSTFGVIYRGTDRWLHNYYPSGGATDSNIFLGKSAGNFTMTSSAGYEASNNIGIGTSVLSSLTTGYQNIAIGVNALSAVTSGSTAVAIGSNSMQRFTGQSSVAVGTNSGRYVSTPAYGNTIFGANAGQGVDTVSTYSYAVIVGFNAGYSLTTASPVGIIIGVHSGYNLTTGASNIILSTTTTSGAAPTTATGSSNIIIGNSSDVESSSASNQMNIGDVIYGTGLYGTGKIGIGVLNASITARLHLPAGSTSATTAPLKFTSGSLMSSPEAGAMEFLSDAYYLTITTGTARQQIVTDTNTVTMTNKTLTAPKFANGGYIADTNGNELIEFALIAGAVNYIKITNASTGNIPLISAGGSDTDIDLSISSKGVGAINFRTGDNARTVLQVVNIASSVNYLKISPSATGGNPILTATGTDSNIGLDFQSKGTGTYRFLGTSSQAAELRLYEDTDLGTNYTAFKVGTQSADLTYTLPTAYAASNGYALTSTTAGVLSWASITGDLVVTILPGEGHVDTATTSFNGTDYNATVDFADATSGYWYMNVKVPKGATSISSIKVFYKRQATGDLYLRFRTGHINTDTASAVATDATDTGAAYTVSSSDGNYESLTVPSSSYNALSGFDEDDIITLELLRQGGSGSDTYSATWRVIAVQFTFA